MRCPRRDTYIGLSTSSDRLEDLANDALADIRATFQRKIEYGVATNALADTRYRLSNAYPDLLFLKNPRTRSGRFIEGSKRVYLLSHEEWLANGKLTVGANYLGRYLYAPAVILLHDKTEIPYSWCRNVLTHETLHSVSLYSRIWSSSTSLVQKHEALIEGITECLLGYILLKQHPDCYESWKSNDPDMCTIAYRERVRLFCSLAQKIGITPLVDFYLSAEGSFTGPWNRFIQSIRLLGYTKFKYELNEQTAFREPLFREVCMRSVEGFKKIYDSFPKSLDFSRIG